MISTLYPILVAAGEVCPPSIGVFCASGNLSLSFINLHSSFVSWFEYSSSFDSSQSLKFIIIIY